jgi:hypothetical protein
MRLVNLALQTLVYVQCFSAIGQGVRIHCDTCSTEQRDEFDLCEACYEKEKGNHVGHGISKQAVSGMGPYAPGSYDTAPSNAAADPAAQGRLREAQYLKLIQHCAECMRKPDVKCPMDICVRLQGHFHHRQTVNDNCAECGKVDRLVRLHAEQCRLIGSQCTVPMCVEMKEQLRKSRGQQAAADALRRAGGTQSSEEEAAAADKEKAEKKATAEAAAAATASTQQSAPNAGDDGLKSARMDDMELAALQEASGNAAPPAAMEKFLALSREERAEVRTRVIANHRPALDASINSFASDPALKDQWQKYYANFKDRFIKAGIERTGVNTSRKSFSIIVMQLGARFSFTWYLCVCSGCRITSLGCLPVGYTRSHGFPPHGSSMPCRRAAESNVGADH